jgi:hypothetical protein
MIVVIIGVVIIAVDIMDVVATAVVIAVVITIVVIIDVGIMAVVIFWDHFGVRPPRDLQLEPLSPMIFEYTLWPSTKSLRISSPPCGRT